MTTHQRFLTHCAGITLLEMLIATLVLSVGVVGILQTTSIGLKMTQHTHATLLAVRGVQEHELERIRNWSFAKLKTKAAVNNWISLTGSESSSELNAMLSALGGTAKYWIDSAPNLGTNSSLKRVTVEVDWTDSTGPRSSILSTWISCGGLTTTDSNFVLTCTG